MVGDGSLLEDMSICVENTDRMLEVTEIDSNEMRRAGIFHKAVILPNGARAPSLPSHPILFAAFGLECSAIRPITPMSVG